ncbi:hypothetical protein [Streptacidiphilus sp. EB129]|uniref:hypothetical protein n=1 Tax=Streptacidiphilus sp. EB129 TaxID=3156262 RepID=UPI0035179D1E
MRARIEIDPNVRVRGNQTYSTLDDVTGPITVGDHVEVYESESGLTGPAQVTAIEGDFVYLAVPWAELSEP